MARDFNLSGAAVPIGVAVGGNLRPTIGHSLVTSGKLTPALVDRVLRVQRDLGLPFGETALRLGLVEEDDVRRALAQQFGYSYLAPGEENYHQELVAAYDPFCDEVDMLRSVRTQLKLRWFSTGRKSLAVIAAQLGAHTGVLIANLGVVFSQLGERTLVVDANLRRPAQQRIFNLGARQGLSDILADLAGEDQITNIPAFSGLSVLPAGTIPPNPQELLCSRRFAELRQSLEARYDVVLYDLPAYPSGSEVLAVAATVGGALVVAGKEQTRLDEVELAGTELRDAGVRIVGSLMIDE